jgi:hypothetical protein
MIVNREALANPSLIFKLILTISNLYGTVLYTIFLGYGVVSVPRELFYAANYKRRLAYLAYKVEKMNKERIDSKKQLTTELQVFKKLTKKLKHLMTIVPIENENFKYIVMMSQEVF